MGTGALECMYDCTHYLIVRIRLYAHCPATKTPHVPMLENSQSRPRFRVFFFFPMTAFPVLVFSNSQNTPLIVKARRTCNENIKKMFKKSARHLEIKRPSMPGTLQLGSSDGIRCNFCLHECTDALFATIRSYAYRPISRDPNFLRS